MAGPQIIEFIEFLECGAEFNKLNKLKQPNKLNKLNKPKELNKLNEPNKLKQRNKLNIRLRSNDNEAKCSKCGKISQKQGDRIKSKGDG